MELEEVIREVCPADRNMQEDDERDGYIRNDKS